MTCKPRDESASLIAADRPPPVVVMTDETPINMLPAELLSAIVTQLPLREHGIFAQTNRRFRAIAENTIREFDMPVINYATNDADQIVKTTRQAKVRGTYADIREEFKRYQQLKSRKEKLDNKCFIDDDMSDDAYYPVCCCCNGISSCLGMAVSTVVLEACIGGQVPVATCSLAAGSTFTSCFLVGGVTIWACRTLNIAYREERAVVTDVLESGDVAPTVRLVMDDDDEPEIEIIPSAEEIRQQRLIEAANAPPQPPIFMGYPGGW